jgi:hypothetical protein
LENQSLLSVRKIEYLPKRLILLPLFRVFERENSQRLINQFLFNFGPFSTVYNSRKRARVDEGAKARGDIVHSPP